MIYNLQEIIYTKDFKLQKKEMYKRVLRFTKEKWRIILQQNKTDVIRFKTIFIFGGQLWNLSINL